LPLFLRS